VRVPDIGGEKFHIAPAGLVAAVGDQRRHYIGVDRLGDRRGLDDRGELVEMS
jgi:hypothetical protein